MMNPFVWARTHLQNDSNDPPTALSQHDVAKDLGLTQQFVQKVEEGLMATAPDSISHYFDVLLTPDQRIEMLNNTLSEIRKFNDGAHHPIKIPRRFVYGSPQFAVPTLGGLYTLWVIYERAILPDLSPVLDTADGSDRFSARNTVKAMVRVARPEMFKDATGEVQWAYELARLLKINPYIIQRWEKLNKAVPPTLRIAVASTGRNGKGHDDGDI